MCSQILDSPYCYTHFFSQFAERAQTAVARADVVFAYGTRVVAPPTEVGLYQSKSLRLQDCNKINRYYGLHNTKPYLQYLCDEELGSGQIIMHLADALKV